MPTPIRLIVFAAAALCASHELWAQPAKGDRLVVELAAARQALADGLYDVAALKASRLLDGIDQANTRSEIAALWIEALVRSGQGGLAIEAIKHEAFPDKEYWRGQAYLLTSDYDQAGAAFEKYPVSGRLHEYAVIGLAHARMGEGREAAARTLTKPLRTSSDETIARYARLLFNELELSTNRAENVVERLSRERGGKDAAVQFLRARARMQLNDLKTSEAILRDMLTTKAIRMTPLTHDAATLLLVEVLTRRHAPEAPATLIAFINSFGAAGGPRDTEFWGEAFTMLRSMASALEVTDESLLAPALAWTIDLSVPERQGYALHYVAVELHRRQRDVEAIGMLEALLQAYPRHPLASESLRLAMQLHGAQRSDARVLELADRWRQQFGGGGGAVVDFLTGLIQFARGEHVAALASFSRAADAETDTRLRRRALYNAAVCALRAGKDAALASVLTQLDQAAKTEAGEKNGSVETGADVQLDRALQLASQIDPSAEEELTQFIKTQTGHPRWVEANIALAEFCLLDVPPRVKTASEALDAAARGSPSRAMQERMSYLRVWLGEARPDLAEVVRAGQAYLSAWPDSQRADEVQMKVAEAYYRTESYAKALTEFELLARNRPKSAYADAAQFYAGLSAMAIPSPENLKAAISAWDELAQRGGPLAFAARRYQALATLRKGDEQQTLALLDALIDDPAASADDRLALVCERAGLLITEGRKNAKLLDEAVTGLRSLLSDKSLRYLWAARCGVLLATALHEKGSDTEALEACYDVINVGSSIVTSPQNPAEFLWYYRAGFLAIDLLEGQKQWEAAARMAERLAQSGGDRAKEASDRASKIRLQHYLWDGDK